MDPGQGQRIRPSAALADRHYLPESVDGSSHSPSKPERQKPIRSRPDAGNHYCHASGSEEHKRPHLLPRPRAAGGNQWPARATENPGRRRPYRGTHRPNRRGPNRPQYACGRQAEGRRLLRHFLQPIASLSLPRQHLHAARKLRHRDARHCQHRAGFQDAQSCRPSLPRRPSLGPAWSWSPVRPEAANPPLSRPS